MPSSSRREAISVMRGGVSTGKGGGSSGGLFRQQGIRLGAQEKPVVAFRQRLGQAPGGQRVDDGGRIVAEAKLAVATLAGEAHDTRFEGDQIVQIEKARPV